MNDAGQAVVDSYMRRLRKQIAPLPRGRREEVVQEIQAHVREALSERGADGEADVRTVLDQLGDPADIAREARERFDVPAAQFGIKESLAVTLLPFGGFVVVGWFLGVVLLWSSDAWTTKEKLIGALLPIGGLATPFYLFRGAVEICVDDGSGGSTCDSSDPTFWLVLSIVTLALAVAVPIWLALRLRRRKAIA